MHLCACVIEQGAEWILDACGRVSSHAHKLHDWLVFLCLSSTGPTPSQWPEFSSQNPHKAPQSRLWLPHALWQGASPHTITKTKKNSWCLSFLQLENLKSNFYLCHFDFGGYFANGVVEFVVIWLYFTQHWNPFRLSHGSVVYSFLLLCSAPWVLHSSFSLLPIDRHVACFKVFF